jgi:FtsH-binding integral membrane protein
MQDNHNVSGNNPGQGYEGTNPYFIHQEANNYQVDKTDIEQGGFLSRDEVKKMMRLGFIKKVYGILSLQLGITISFMALAFVEGVKTFLQENVNPLFWIALGLSLAILIPLVCFKSIARGVPQNYILLFSWTICESYMLATAVTFYDPQIVMLAGFLTFAVTAALTLYACTTKTDFTFCGGFLFCCVTILFFWSLFSLIFGFYSNTLYCCLGVIVYSIYLIYDTQMVMGKFGSEFDVDDYVFAALSIYLDIINLFIKILQILGKK